MLDSFQLYCYNKMSFLESVFWLQDGHSAISPSLGGIFEFFTLFRVARVRERQKMRQLRPHGRVN